MGQGHGTDTGEGLGGMEEDGAKQGPPHAGGAGSGSWGGQLGGQAVPKPPLGRDHEEGGWKIGLRWDSLQTLLRREVPPRSGHDCVP